MSELIPDHIAYCSGGYALQPVGLEAKNVCLRMQRHWVAKTGGKAWRANELVSEIDNQ